MNFIVFDPTFLEEERLPILIQRLRIKEIYSLLPKNKETERLLNYSTVPISIKRQEGEDIDSVKVRAIFYFLRGFSHPINTTVEYSGQFAFDDVFKNSLSNNFSWNLNLDDPNILILQSYVKNKAHEGEDSKISFFRHMFNILKHHSEIDYTKRICVSPLPMYIILENPEGYIVREVIEELDKGFSDVEDFARFFLKEDGLKYRKELIVERKEEHEKEQEEWMESCDSSYEVDIKAEMDYISNNGGDWIDD